MTTQPETTVRTFREWNKDRYGWEHVAVGALAGLLLAALT